MNETMDYCKETGNRLRIECHFDDPADETNEEFVMQLPTFRSCLRVKAIESRRFAHFLSPYY
ncbi:hypothetical protein BGW41_006513 [Actinomortierella wolfii]|nr:hypothetical protein BGW41_006513 [Actinomortierella wolfii]